MKYIEISTHRRSGKIIYNTIALLLVLIVTAALGTDLRNEFSWWTVILLLVLAFAVIGFTVDLYQALIYDEIKVGAEITDKRTVTFYNTAKGKKWNISEHKLSNMAEIYITEKTRRKALIHDKYLEYKTIEPTPDSVVTVEILPELFQAKEEDLNKLLIFIKNNLNKTESKEIV